LAGFHAVGLSDEDHRAIRAGDAPADRSARRRFVARLEAQLDRKLVRQKPGPKPKTARDKYLCPRNSPEFAPRNLCSRNSQNAP
jgi:hypothetical protein